jgi:hypothetical protein
MNRKNKIRFLFVSGKNLFGVVWILLLLGCAASSYHENLIENKEDIGHLERMIQ